MARQRYLLEVKSLTRTPIIDLLEFVVITYPGFIQDDNQVY
jgi:hypothetical protein